MNILIVVGSCLRINTSANLCHLSYIQGCLDAGKNVDVIAMSERGCIVDNSIVLPKGAHWFFFDQPMVNSSPITINKHPALIIPSILKGPVRTIKNNFLKLYGIYGRSAQVWMNRAQKFSSSKQYDYVISLATPYVSHRLAANLIKKKRVNYGKWIQIWEDPWTLDLYNKSSTQETFKEEGVLLAEADQVIYSSPLTLKYQQEEFPDEAFKMSWHTLPYYYEEDDTKNQETINVSTAKVFGYFGDYYKFSRNLEPFYNAAKATGFKTEIVGNSDLNLKSTGSILISARVGLSELSKLQNKTNVYVFLCNLGGGQIPGKLYQYSVSDKPILFILDGRSSEIAALKSYFSPFHRFVFCDNNEESIANAMREISLIISKSALRQCLRQFSPRNTIDDILHTSIESNISD